jgi:hypothetical protein
MNKYDVLNNWLIFYVKQLDQFSIVKVSDDLIKKAYRVGNR